METLPAVGSVWTDLERRAPPVLTGLGLVVVTEVSAGAWGPRCTAVAVDGVGALSGPLADVLHGRTLVGTVTHAFTAGELRDAGGDAARRLRAGALALALDWFEAPRPGGERGR